MNPILVCSPSTAPTGYTLRRVCSLLYQYARWLASNAADHVPSPDALLIWTRRAQKLYPVILVAAGMFATTVILQVRSQALVSRSIVVYAKVKPGDTVWSISRWSGVAPERIYDANPAITDPSKLNAGEKLRVPAANEQLIARTLPAIPQVTSPPATSQIAAAVQRPPAPAPAPPPVIRATYSGTTVWDRIAKCESSGNWADNTGNGYYGGLQFSLGSWRAVGGTGLPSQASREEQISRAVALQAREGWGAWPVCSAKLGL